MPVLRNQLFVVAIDLICCQIRMLLPVQIYSPPQSLFSMLCNTKEEEEVSHVRNMRIIGGNKSESIYCNFSALHC